YGVLLDNSGSIVATTNTVSLTNPMFNTFVNYNFSSPVGLTAGQDYYVGLAIPTGTTYPIGNIIVPGTVHEYYSTGITGGAMTPVDFGFMAIEGVFTFTNTWITLSASKNVICKGESVTLTSAGGASTYTWSANATNTSTTSVVVS